MNTLLLLGGLTFLSDLQHSLQGVDEEDGNEDECDFQLKIDGRIYQWRSLFPLLVHILRIGFWRPTKSSFSDVVGDVDAWNYLQSGFRSRNEGIYTDEAGFSPDAQSHGQTPTYAFFILKGIGATIALKSMSSETKRPKQTANVSASAYRQSNTRTKALTCVIKLSNITVFRDQHSWLHQDLGIRTDSHLA